MGQDAIFERAVRRATARGLSSARGRRANRVHSLVGGDEAIPAALHHAVVVHEQELDAGRGHERHLFQAIRGVGGIVLLAIDREVLRLEGPRGYRQALLEAGILGGRLYLEAERRGLGACTVGAFLDEEFAEAVGLDPSRWWVVQLSALGLRAD